jgi:hypothetical protein
MRRAALRQVVPVVQTTVFDAYIGGLAPSGRRGITSLLNRSASILNAVRMQPVTVGTT